MSSSMDTDQAAARAKQLIEDILGVPPANLVDRSVRCLISWAGGGYDRDDYYVPGTVRIGPFHWRDHLTLDKQSTASWVAKKKMAAAKSLLTNESEPAKRQELAESLVEAMKETVPSAKKCYDRTFDWMTSDVFAEMLLLDGCFVYSRFVPIETGVEITGDITDESDIMFLLENQIPFSVLEKIHEWSTGTGRMPPNTGSVRDQVAKRVQKVLKRSHYIAPTVAHVPADPCHILHLLYMYFSPTRAQDPASASTSSSSSASASASASTSSFSSASSSSSSSASASSSSSASATPPVTTSASSSTSAPATASASSSTSAPAQAPASAVTTSASSSTSAPAPAPASASAVTTWASSSTSAPATASASSAPAAAVTTTSASSWTSALAIASASAVTTSTSSSASASASASAAVTTSASSSTSAPASPSSSPGSVGCCCIDVKNLLHGWVSSEPLPQGRNSTGRWRTATQYYAANVGFVKRELDNVRARSILDVDLIRHKLHIPCLNIDTNTFRMLRNMVALEQKGLRQPSSRGSRHVTAYCLFLSQLAGTKEDVALLVSKGIIAHLLHSDDDVAQELACLCDGVTIKPDDPDTNYLKNEYEALEKLYSSHFGRSMAWLCHDKCDNYCKLAAAVAASLVTIATVLQLVLAGIDYGRGK